MDGYLVFVNTDDEGNIIEARMGISPVPNKKYTFFFYFEEEFTDDITEYRVEINGYETNLVKKDNAE